MGRTFFVSLFTMLSVVASAQRIERKIIIEKGNYYFTSVDDETQLATLWTGADSSSIRKASKFALPAGRNLNDPINPFCWDIISNNVYAVSFLMHPMNDRNEAIKRFKATSLAPHTSAIKPVDLILQSVEMSPIFYNDPYLFVTRRSNILENFFFDAVALNDTSFWMAIANKGELTIWNHDGKSWKHSEVQNFPVSGFFSIFTNKGKVFLATSAGGLYEISLKGVASIKNKSVGVSLETCTLVMDKDENAVWYIRNSDINQHTSIRELISKKGINVF